MTESWRLVAGDHFLRDKFCGTHQLYILINGLIFKYWQDITLLDFRRIQYVVTICSLLLFGFALYRFDRQYWYQPLVFSLFAFTGLDPIGMISNLNYHTYPHLFLTLHVAFFLLALFQDNLILKRFLYIMAGFSLWGISLSLLHLSLVVLSPIIIFTLFRKVRSETISFGFRDLVYMLAPVAGCWLVFVGIYNIPYLLKLLASVKISTTSHPNLVSINWEAIKHIVISAIYLVMCYYVSRKFRSYLSIPIILFLSIMMFAVMTTSLFGLMKPYWRGWFSYPMWLTSFLLSFMILFFCSVARKLLTGNALTAGEEISLVIMVPSTILTVSDATFSGLGVLTVLYYAIPIMASMVLTFLYDWRPQSMKVAGKFALILLLVAPFYTTTAWFDWKFTFFDFTPREATTTISKGFGRGIRTNAIYNNLYNWIRAKAETYSDADDFMISYTVSPMTHMIARRRPATGDTFICFDWRSPEYFRTSVEEMKKDQRYPAIAFVFESYPAFEPSSADTFVKKWFPRQFIFPGNDAISSYIIAYMVLADEFRISEGNVVRFFVDKKRKAERDINNTISKMQQAILSDPDNASLHLKLGKILQKKGDLVQAIEHYIKALEIRPDDIKVLGTIAIAYSLAGDNESALNILHKMIDLESEQPDPYYNIACIYAKQRNQKEAIEWLRMSLKKGFKDWNLLQNDPDLNNIRNTEEFQSLINKFSPNSR